KLDETIRGHVFCSFLALVLKAELEERIAALGRVANHLSRYQHSSADRGSYSVWNTDSPSR
ncbi:MAG: hypothetical protein WB822_04250, partial [Rhodoplanes sp.]